MASVFHEPWTPTNAGVIGDGLRPRPRARTRLAVVAAVAVVVLAFQAGAPIRLASWNGTLTSNGHDPQPAGIGGHAKPPASTGQPAASSGATAPGTSTPTSAPTTSPTTSSATAPGSTTPMPSTTTTQNPQPQIAAPTTSSPATIAVSASTPLLAGGTTPVYLHYYLWWTARHWQDKLGAAYPYTANPLPLPGQTDASGCNPTVSYPGATIVDIPSAGLQDQSLAATFDSHIATAVAFGITGFVADWAGTGAVDQAPSSSGYNARLDLLVQRVSAWNAGHSQKFRLALDFAAFGNYSRPASAIINDLSYFAGRYGGNEAFANAFSTHPLVMIIGSRKYSLATIQAISAAARPALFLLGDENYSTLPRDAAYLDGSSYYWSSESPTNSGAKTQIASLGSQLHGAGKPWFAPFTAGYDSVLIGGHCVPRNGVSTLDTIWAWNGASHPDAWFGISWNEYVENTYLEPSLKYGTTYLTEIARLAGT